MTEKDVARTYRNRRYPLRPWSEYEWFKTRDMPPFRRRSMEYAKEVERVKQAKKDGRYAVITLKKPEYWTERAQMHLGDRSIQLEAIAKNEWQFGEDERAAQIRYTKSWEQVSVPNLSLCVDADETADSGRKGWSQAKVRVIPCFVGLCGS